MKLTSTRTRNGRIKLSMLEDKLLIEMRTTIDGKKIGLKVAITKEACNIENVKLNAEKMYEAILKYKADMKKESVEKENL